MSNCFSLISCDGTCSNIHNIKGTSVTLLTPFLNTLVQVNNNKDCIYYVRDEKMVGFQIDSADFLCSSARNLGFLIDYRSVQYKVTSLVYNGIQYINNPITYSLNYTTGYQCLNCQTTEGAFCSTVVSSTYNNSNAHTNQINGILQRLGLSIRMFPFGINGSSVFRIYDSDILEFELERIGTNSPGKYTMFFDGTNLTVEFNTVAITNNLVNESTYTCTEKSGRLPTINSVSGVSACTLTNTFADYLPVSECDFISIQPMNSFCLVSNSIGVIGATRTATLVVTGGTPPYSFLWENGNRTNTISNLPPGTYDVTITDYFGDFVINTSCTLPNIVCNELTTIMSYECVTIGGLNTGQAILSIRSSRGLGPYTYTGSLNGNLIPTTLTNGMTLNNGDSLTNIVTTDANGCTASTSNIYVICPIADPPDPEGQIRCTSLVACTTPPTFNFGISATTYDVNDPSNPLYYYEFKFNLSSSYTGKIVGSYKIYDVDFPNSFLTRDIFDIPQLNTNLYQSNYIDLQKYYFNANGTPIVELNNYIEFGFSELTPTNPTNLDSPWYITYIPFYELKSQTPNTNWYTPPNGVWVPGSTSVQIDIVLFTEEYCIVSGTTNITIPTTTLTNSTTITF